ncbi:MAG TPA: hypothetical protein VHC63_18470 [Acidimicrobiales bacterium]|nr:hypothetical protein [Acidimicrobiales bacterium]
MRGLRFRHFALAWPVLFVVLLVASVLLLVPGLSWGWWSAIGGVGTPVFGVSNNTAGSPLEWVIPALFAVMLIPALPLFAEAEERMFRLGAEQWSNGRRVRRAVEFGLAHALIGIPIGVALALSIGGLYFTWAYLRGGVPESTRAHLAYNLTIVFIIAVALLAG